MKRNYLIPVKASLEEKEKIRKNAEKLGMNVGSYLRHLGLRVQIKFKGQESDE